MEDNSNNFYSTILDSIDCGVFTIDLDFKITTFNKAASDITGFSKEEAVNNYCYEILRTNICQNNCTLKKTFLEKKAFDGIQVDILNKNGETIPVTISTNLLKDDQGKIIGGIETFRDIRLVEELRKEVKKSYKYRDIVSKNYRILKIFDILPDIAASDATILILGPSGSGKEVFARAIHNTGNKKNGPFVAVNCGALPDSLLESELFGYEKGAFTDAYRSKPGRFLLADKGTIFLDEIGDTSKAMQVKLLRVLEERAFEPLGSVKTVKVDIRIIAATNKDLYELVKHGKFREDLYYRLNVVKIELPPLKDRKEDIPLLIESFINKFNLIKGKRIEGITEDAMIALMNYDYPGNIRQLENIIEHAFIMVKGKYIDIDHLTPEVKEFSKTKGVNEMGLKNIEKDTIIKALNLFNGNKKRVASYLNINRTTLWRKLKKYDLN